MSTITLAFKDRAIKRVYLPVHAHDHARSAVPTLGSIVLCNPFLYRMKPFLRAKGNTKYKLHQNELIYLTHLTVVNAYYMYYVHCT